MQRLNLAATLALLAAALFFGLRSQALLQSVVAGATSLDERVRALEATPTPPRPLDASRIEVGDVVEVLDRHRSRDFGEREVVGTDGMILLAHLGWTLVAGLTREELTERLDEAYRAYYDDLTVSVRVTKPRRTSSASGRLAADQTGFAVTYGPLSVDGMTRAEIEDHLITRPAQLFEAMDPLVRVDSDG